MSESTPTPTDDERRHAACVAMASAPGLIRFASRFTRSLHDAEDAYQRAMEIALTRAPVVEPGRYMAWLHTVLRNEALAVARARHREGPGAEADVVEAYGDQLLDQVPLDALAEWRERYRSIQDGLGALTEAQRICLILQSAGASYERIREITGYSLRKVERSVLEGRKGLVAWEVRLASGEACARLDDAIGRVARGEATARERRQVTRHVRHCGPCRAALRHRRDSSEGLAALVPVALLGGQVMVGAPDPSPVLAWWERVAAGATVRAGSAVQVAMDLPAAALAKVGAGTAAVAVAGVAGTPLVVEAMTPAGPATGAAVVAPVSSAAATPAPDGAGLARAASGTGDGVRASFARARRSAAETAARERARRRAARPTRAARPRASAGPAGAHVVLASSPPTPPPHAPSAPAPAAAPAPLPSAPEPSTSAVALEFGP